MTLRSRSHTVGKTISAVNIPKKWRESRWIPAQLNEVPGKSLVRLSPSKIINSTQYDCTRQRKELSQIWKEFTGMKEQEATKLLPEA